MTEIETVSRRSIGSARNPESHEAILDAAEAIFAEEGYAGFSIEAVARRAKAGKPTIYRWWPSKAHLLLDVYTRLKDAHMAEPNTGSVTGDIRAFLTKLLGFWRGPNGEVFRSILAEGQTDARAIQALKEYCLDRVTHTGRIFERAKARGEIRDDVDSFVASDLLSAYAWKLLLTGRLEQAEDGIKTVAEVMTRGMLK